MATRVNGKTYSFSNPDYGLSYTLNPFFYYIVSETPTTYTLTLYGGVKATFSGSGAITVLLKMTGTGQTDKWESTNVSTSQDYIIIPSYTWSWNKTKSTQSKTITSTFGGINADFSVDWYPSYKATKAFTIPTITTYAITYNANGGSGAPGGQTKWHGEDINLQAGVPTRAGYKFICWNTKQDGTGTNYNPSQKYSTNSALTLYAKWQALNKITIYDTDGNPHTGKLMFYDANGQLHNCEISVYDENGNRHQPT